MGLLGKTVSENMHRQSDDIMNKTFSNDGGYRYCRLFSRNMEYLEDVEIKHQFSQVYTVNKDQVEYLAQFKPGFHPEKKYMEPDGIERFGFYLEIPDPNTGVAEMWLLLGKNDKNSFIRYNILKCNWTFSWVKNKVIYTCLGVIRNRNNYNSGVWSDGFFTSVDNQAQFIVPTTIDTSTIDYNDRFMLCDTIIRPLVYEVSKIEDTFPCGVTKITLKQDHYNEHLDNKELKICNYYDSAIIPENPQHDSLTLQISGTSPTLHIGGSQRTVLLISDSDTEINSIRWYYSFNNKNHLTNESLANDFIIQENANGITISALKIFDNIGKIIKIIAELPDGHSCSIDLEVKR